MATVSHIFPPKTCLKASGRAERKVGLLPRND